MELELGWSTVIQNAEKFEWYCMADPGTTTSAFAVMFAAYYRPDPYLFILDEIYEKDPAKTTPGNICPEILRKMRRYYTNVRAWKAYYDPAAAWFAQDANQRFGNDGLIFKPSTKRQGDKEEGIAVINELMCQNRVIISTTCVNTIWEIDNYYKDDRGNYIKKNDHEIDNFRYLTKMARIVIKETEPLTPTSKPRKARSKRFFSIDNDDRTKHGLNWIQHTLKKYGE